MLLILSLHHCLVCIEFDLVKITYAVESKLQGLMTKAKILRDYPQDCNSLGSIPSECSIHLKPDAIPVVHPPHRIPLMLIDKCKAEPDRMVELGVILPVKEPCQWMKLMVFVEKKSGRLRICLDPHDLIKNVQ